MSSPVPLPPPPPPALSKHVGYLLRLAHAYAHGVAEAMLPDGWTPHELGVLVSLLDDGPHSQRGLADRLGVNRTQMVAIVDQVELRGLVARRRDPSDRRAYALALTGPGRAAITDVETRVLRGQEWLLGPLAADRRERLVELLRPLAAERPELLPSRLRSNPGFLLAKAHLRSRDRINGALAPLGIEVRDAGHLTLLDAAGPTSQRALADQLYVTGAAIVAVVDGLERRGLVRRERNPADRRAHLLVITDDGHATLERAWATVDAEMAAICAPLGPGGQDELRGLLLALLGVEG